MSETKETPTEEPAFRRVPLERVGELKDLKGIKEQFSDSLSRKKDEAYREFPEGARSFEQKEVNRVMREHRVNIELSRLGSETWQNNKIEGVVTERWQEPIAGVYLALLGSAQEINPEGVDRIQKARMLREGSERSFMALSKFYDDMVEDSLRPGCVGRLMGRKGRTIDEVISLEERVVASLEKPPEA